MAKAGPGEIYVSQAALIRSRSPFAADELEPFMVKGKAAPVHAFCLGRAVGGGAGRGGQEKHDWPPLVGRDVELELLTRRLEGARAGRGTYVELEGPSGIGKTRLIQEVRVRAEGHRTLSVVCDEYRSVTPYAPLRDLGRQCLGLEADTDPAQSGVILAEVVKHRAPELGPWLPLLANVVEAEVPPTPESNALDERFRRPRLEESFLALLRALLPEPTLIVIDDAHQMDDASVELLRRLAANVAPLPWLVVSGRRSQASGLMAHDIAGVAHIELSPLADDAVSDLVRAATEERPLPPHRRTAVAKRSGGNPLFLLELLANDTGNETGAALPDSIEGVFAAQIDRLSPPDRRLLRVASVLGVQVPVPVLSAMVGEPVSAKRLEPLGEFLAADGPGTLHFRHNMLRDAAYEGLPYARRRLLHAQAGQVLEKRAGRRAPEIAGLLAVHFGAAGHHLGAWHYARIAAERAWAVYASVEAATFFHQALEAGRAAHVSGAELLAVAEALGDARGRLGEFTRAEAAYRIARRWARAPVDRARLHYKVALMADRAGHYPAALRTLSLAERSLGDAREAASARLRAEIRVHYGRVRQRQGRSRDTVRLLQGVPELARLAGAREVEAQALIVLDQAELTVGLPGDGERARLALEILRDIGGQLWLEGRALNEMGFRAFYAGRWSEAATYYDGARSAWERAGDQWTAALTLGNIAEILSNQGHLAEAEEMLTEAMRTFRAVGTPSFIALGALLLGRLAARRGDHERARASLEEARNLFAADGEAQGVVHAQTVLAESHLLAGSVETARSLAAETLAEATKLAGRDLLLPLLLRVLAVAEASLEEQAVAREHLERSIEVAHARKYPYELALSLQAMASLWPETATNELRTENEVSGPGGPSWTSSPGTL
jgi:tetratricopeptide (TPR) repeat protein